MKRLLATAAIALSVTTAAQAANKNTVMFASNNWRVSQMAPIPPNAPNPSCIMSSQLTFPDGALGFVNIMNYAEHLSVYISKTNWQFSPDTQVPVSVNTDNGHRDLFGVTKRNKGVKYSSIHADGIDDDWLDEFASSQKMTITFKGNEPQWTVKMGGSRDATKAFRSCIKILREDATASATSPVPDSSDDKSLEQAPTSPVPTAPKKTVPVKKLQGEGI
jgi:hypothetical protein